MDGRAVNGDGDVKEADLQREIEEMKEALKVEQSKKKDITCDYTFCCVLT